MNDRRAAEPVVGARISRSSRSPSRRSPSTRSACRRRRSSRDPRSRKRRQRGGHRLQASNWRRWHSDGARNAARPHVRRASRECGRSPGPGSRGATTAALCRSRECSHREGRAWQPYPRRSRRSSRRSDRPRRSGSNGRAPELPCASECLRLMPRPTSRAAVDHPIRHRRAVHETMASSADRPCPRPGRCVAGAGNETDDEQDWRGTHGGPPLASGRDGSREAGGVDRLVDPDRFDCDALSRNGRTVERDGAYERHHDAVRLSVVGERVYRPRRDLLRGRGRGTRETPADRLRRRSAAWRPARRASGRRPRQPRGRPSACRASCASGRGRPDDGMPAAATRLPAVAGAA